MVAVPGATPMTKPLSEPTEAIPVADDVHNPPGTPSNNGVVAPVQTPVTPVIGVGVVETVTVRRDRQPVGNV